MDSIIIDFSRFLIIKIITSRQGLGWVQNSTCISWNYIHQWLVLVTAWSLWIDIIEIVIWHGISIAILVGWSCTSGSILISYLIQWTLTLLTYFAIIIEVDKNNWKLRNELKMRRRWTSSITWHQCPNDHLNQISFRVIITWETLSIDILAQLLVWKCNKRQLKIKHSFLVTLNFS